MIYQEAWRQTAHARAVHVPSTAATTAVKFTAAALWAIALPTRCCKVAGGTARKRRDGKRAPLDANVERVNA